MITSSFITRMRNRAVLSAVLLAVAALAVGASSASANSNAWGDNGSGTCSAYYATLEWTAADPELGTYCMQSVTGWISINGGASQQQAISCSNNAPGGSPGLSYSLDGQAYVNNPQWYAVAVIEASGSTQPGVFAGWQTGDGGDADLSSELWDTFPNLGNASTNTYGSAGAGVTNWGGNGNWQAALACLNVGGTQMPCSGTSCPLYPKKFSTVKGILGRASAAPVRIRDKKIDAIDRAKGRAFLAQEYALKKGVTRTDTRSCPAGMVRRGKLSYTVQEFPADNKSPKWKDRSLVDVKMTTKGKNAGSVTMTLTRAKNPTVVQFQLRCGKR